MDTRLVPFRCPSCGHQTFRYRTAYEQMLAASGRATCLLCPPSVYGAPASRQELLAVAQALNARSHERLAALPPRGAVLY
jgi:hypothetical protein